MNGLSNSFNITLSMSQKQDYSAWQVTQLNLGSLDITNDRLFFKTHVAAQSLLQSLNLPAQLQVLKHQTVTIIGRHPEDTTSKPLQVVDTRGQEIIDISTLADPETIKQIDEFIQTYTQAISFFHVATHQKNAHQINSIETSSQTCAHSTTPRSKRVVSSTARNYANTTHVVPKSKHKQISLEHRQNLSEEPIATQRQEKVHSDHLQRLRLWKRHDWNRLSQSLETLD